MQYTDSTPDPAGGTPPNGVDDQLEGVSLTERFENFHRVNPHFYQAIVDLARRFRAKTGRTCGVQRLVEIARFDIDMTTAGDEEFKVNNDFAAFYARLIMFQEEDLVGFFNLRAAREADEWAAGLYRAEVA